MSSAQPAPTAQPVRRNTIRDLAALTARGEKWPMLTAYDQYAAQIFDRAGVPALLVGDSAANNVLGFADTVPVTVAELIPFVRSAAQAHIPFQPCTKSYDQPRTHT